MFVHFLVWLFRTNVFFFWIRVFELQIQLYSSYRDCHIISVCSLVHQNICSILMHLLCSSLTRATKSFCMHCAATTLSITVCALIIGILFWNEHIQFVFCMSVDQWILCTYTDSTFIDPEKFLHHQLHLTSG